MAEPFIYFTCYDLITGEIKLVRIAQPPDEQPGDGVPDGMGWLLGTPHPDTHYIDPATVVVTERPVVPPMTGATYDLNQLSAGGVLTVTDEEDVVTEIPAQDDTLELTDPGLYQVRSVSLFPYIDFEAEIIV